MIDMRKKYPLLIAGIVMFCIITLISIIGPFLLKEDPNEMNITRRLEKPSMESPLGRDEFGRDLFTRIVYGGRISISVGLTTAFLSVALGLIMGLYAGYYKTLGNIIMRISDGMTAIPAILLAIALMSAFGASQKNVIIALVIVYTPGTARLVRSSVIKINGLLYIDAIRTQGATNSRLIWKHIMPNILTILAIQLSFIFAEAVISEASLSFLGVGIPAPNPSWGNIIFGGKTVINKAPWIILSGVSAILLSVLSLNFIGDGIRDLLNPNYEGSISRKKLDKAFEKAYLEMDGIDK